MTEEKQPHHDQTIYVTIWAILPYQELIQNIVSSLKNLGFVFGFFYGDGSLAVYSEEQIVYELYRWETCRVAYGPYDFELVISRGTDRYHISFESFSDTCLSKEYWGFDESVFSYYLVKYDILIPLLLNLTKKYPIKIFGMFTDMNLLDEYLFDRNGMPLIEKNNIMAYFSFGGKYSLQNMFENARRHNYYFKDKQRNQSIENIEYLVINTNYTEVAFYVIIGNFIAHFSLRGHFVFLRPIPPFKTKTIDETCYTDTAFYAQALINILQGLPILELHFEPYQICKKLRN